MDADAHLTVIRKLTNFAATSPNAMDGATAVAALADLSRLVANLDAHLSAGGTPPEAWREGPDAPADWHQCDRCGGDYVESAGDGYCGLCPRCADATDEDADR